MLRKDLIRALERAPRRIEPSDRRSAVAAIFDRHDRLLLVRRAEREGDPWSGHLSFPGGRLEAHDRGALDAALRETLEEVELPLSERALVGSLDDLVAIGGAPGMVIHPYVFHDDTLDIHTFASSFRPNAEVAAVMGWSLDALLSGEGRGTMQLTRHGQTWTLPCVDREGQRLWGLTLRMVDDLLERLRLIRSDQ